MFLYNMVYRVFIRFIRLLSETISSCSEAVSSCLIVCLFAVKPTMWACQGESPGKCQLSEKWGLLINRPAMELCAMKPLWGTAERWRGEKRGPTTALNKWRKSWSEKRERERENQISLPLWHGPLTVLLPAVWAGSYDCQSALEALCEIWHLNIEILRY